MVPAFEESAGPGSPCPFMFLNLTPSVFLIESLPCFRGPMASLMSPAAFSNFYQCFGWYVRSLLLRKCCPPARTLRTFHSNSSLFNPHSHLPVSLLVYSVFALYQVSRVSEVVWRATTPGKSSLQIYNLQRLSLTVPPVCLPLVLLLHKGF